MYSQVLFPDIVVDGDLMWDEKNDVKNDIISLAHILQQNIIIQNKICTHRVCQFNRFLRTTVLQGNSKFSVPSCFIGIQGLQIFKS